jgi:translation initiation factor 1 (eIF-1/SUI1)
MGGCGEEVQSDGQNSTEIPFTEYSLVETNCQWVNFETNKVLIINSQSEMDKYITCIDGNYSEIDFKKNTLLLAKGVTTNGISTLSEKLLISGNEYILEVEIVLGDAAVVQEWHIALVSEKLNSKTNVGLNVIIIKN